MANTLVPGARRVSLRSMFIAAGNALTDDGGLLLTLAPGERIVNVDHEGASVWVYIETTVEAGQDG